MISFKLKNAGETYQQLVNTNKLEWKTMEIYVDDMITNLENNIQHLVKMFRIL